MSIWQEEILVSPYIKYLIMEVEYTISQFLEIWPEIHFICESLCGHLVKGKL